MIRLDVLMIRLDRAPRLVDVAVGAVLIYASATAVWESVRRPLWYDEIFTVVLAQLPTMAHIVDALAQAADTSGPLY